MVVEGGLVGTGLGELEILDVVWGLLFLVCFGITQPTPTQWPL